MPIKKDEFIGFFLEVYKTENMVIHRAGCKDIAKVPGHEAYRGTTVQEVQDKLLSEDIREMGYGPEHVKIFPCCK
jgi:hypothetical protein